MMVSHSPEHRPWRKRKLHGAMENLAFGLQLLLGTPHEGKGITKVVK